MSVLAESSLARPTKARRSVRLVGAGKLEIASVMDLLMEYPRADSKNPAKVTCDWANSHLSMFSVICCSAQRYRNCQTWSVC